MSAGLMIGSASLGAQSTAGQVSARAPQPASSAGAIAGGVLGAGLGLVGGAFFGYQMACSNSSCHGLQGLGETVLGAAVGEVFFLAIGVHAGNGSAGNLAADLGTSVAAGAGVLLFALGTNSLELLLFGAAAQVGLTVRTERRTGRHRGLEVGLVPQVLTDGRRGLSLQIRF